MLSNQTYVGDYTWNVSHEGKYCGISNGTTQPNLPRGRNPEVDWVFIPNNHEPLIDRKTFGDVNRKLAAQQQNKTPKQNGGEFVFTSLLHCGQCGSPMHGRTTPNRETTYVCSSHIHHGGDAYDRNSVRQDQLLDVIVDRIEKQLTDPDHRKRQLGDAEDQAHKSCHPEQKRDLKRQLAEINGKLAQLKKRLLEVDRDMLPVVQQGIRDLRTEQGCLKAELKDARRSPKQVMAEHNRKFEKALKSFAKLRDSLTKSDALKTRELLRQFVGKVEVWTRKNQHGKRAFYVLDHGLIHLCPNSPYNMFATSQRSV